MNKEYIRTPQKVNSTVKPPIIAFPLKAQYASMRSGSQRSIGGAPVAVKAPNSAPKNLPLNHLGNPYQITAPPATIAKKNNRLAKFSLLDVSRHILPDYRVSKCYRTVVGNHVEVWQSAQNTHHYKGVMMCGSVWHCPVCSSKISERRRQDLTVAMDNAKVMGLTPYLVTYTIPHHQKQKLKDLLKKFNYSRSLFYHRKSWKTYSRQIGLSGSVKALELTQGENGWHVHLHELLFCKNGRPEPTAAELLPLWQKAALSAGLQCPNEHGVKVDHGQKAQDYITKWGAESEMTKSMIKHGREGSRTPWDILRDFELYGDEQDAELFREYAKAFQGKKQLIWSKGLRTLLQMQPEKTDEQIAAEQEAGSQRVGIISKADWKLILQYDKRGEVLDLADAGGMEAVNELIRKLRRKAAIDCS